ncbi:phage tail protein, partial [Streptomyces sp. C3-3]|nr:phage tail protein [Streptomyces sp. C3-3]
MVNITRAADLALVGANGGGWTAPVGTAAPASPLAQPAAPWEPLGAISDDGLTYGFDEDSQTFTPWGLTSPFRTQITQSIRTFGLTVWETNRVVVQSLQYRLDVAALEPDG